MGLRSYRRKIRNKISRQIYGTPWNKISIGQAALVNSRIIQKEHKHAQPKLKNYELVTTKTEFDMPFQIHARNEKEAEIKATQKLERGEKILSLREG